MKNTKSLIILCLILFLTAIGCSDYYNWLAEDLEYMEENQYEKEGGDENEIETIKFVGGEEEYIETDINVELEKKDVDVNKIYYENEKKQDIDSYKDSELDKRDKDGNKTYWENEQDSEF